MASLKQVRRSVTLPGPIAKQVESIARRRRLSDNRVLVELIELGIEASKQRERAFFELAERFRGSKDSGESKRLGEELGRFVFGEVKSVSVIHPSSPPRGTISECVALLPEDSTATMDADFARDTAAAIESRREALEPPAWD